MLEKLFTSKNRIKIMGFLFFKEKESHIRGVSNKLKISPSAVKREIENLENLGIIKKEGNKIILNNKSNILEDLKNIFIKTDYIFYPLKEGLRDNRIKFAFIFGSFARGDCSNDSDIDLMIIGDLKLSEVLKLTNPLENKINREINPVTWTFDNLKKQKNSGFVRDIFKKGIIMIKGEENEIQRIIR